MKVEEGEDEDGEEVDEEEEGENGREAEGGSSCRVVRGLSVEASWRPFWDILGPRWDFLGPLGALGAAMGDPGGLLGSSCVRLWASWEIVGANGSEFRFGGRGMRVSDDRKGVRSRA